MVSDRIFWIITRIAAFEGIIIFTIILYFLLSDSNIGQTKALPLGLIAALVTGILLSFAEKKYRTTRKNNNATI